MPVNSLEPTTAPTTSVRDNIGRALYWLGITLAALASAFGVITAIRVFVVPAPDTVGSGPAPYVLVLSMIIGGTAIATAVPWLVGLTCRHLLCTDTPQLRTSTYNQIARVGFVFAQLWLAWAAVVAMSALWNGRTAITAALLMILFLRLGLSCNRYVAPHLRRWASTANTAPNQLRAISRRA